MDDFEEKIFLSQIPKPQLSRFRARTVSSILDRLIVERGYAAQQSTQLLNEQWQAAVGETLAAQSRVGKISRGVLQVIASNSIVLSELNYAKSTALKHLQASLPEFKLRDIRFKLSK